MADLSISRAWEETKAVLASDGRLFASVALALIGLPSAVTALVAPQGIGVEHRGPAWVDALTFLFMLLALVGQLAIVRLALKPSITVGGAIAHGARRMPVYLLTAIILVAGLLVIAIPLGIAARFLGVPLDAMSAPMPPAGWVLAVIFLAILFYLAARMILGTSVASAEHAGPVAIIKRSWMLTDGHVGKLLGFLALILLGAVVMVLVIGVTVGSLVALTLGQPDPLSASALVVGIVQGLFNAAFSAIFAVMLTRIYVQLAGRDTAER